MGRAVALVLLLDLVLVRVWDPLPVEALRLRVFDLYQVMAPREAKERPVVIVDIDEDSLRSLGQWPWPRTVVADIVDRVTRAGAAAIAFDVVFSEPDRSSPALAAESFRGLDDETRAKLKSLPSNDAVLAEAVARSRVILGQTAVQKPSAAPEGEPPPQTPFGVLGPTEAPPLVAFPGLLRNVPELERAAAGRGLFTIRPEPDGIVRRVPIVMRAGGQTVPSLTLEMLRVVSASPAILLKTDAHGLQMESVRLRGFEIPTDGLGQLWIHFGRHDRARFVPAADVLAGRVDPDRFRQRLVLFGTSAVGLLDLKTTPTEPAMPGVEVHAQVLESMLSRTVLSAPFYGTLAEIALAALVGLAVIAFAPALGAWALFWIGGIMAALIAGVSWYYFARLNLLIDATYPLASSFLVYLTLVFTNYLRAHSERRQIRSAFGQYLSPVLVEELARSPEKLTLGGEERVMTVMFSDVRGFTTISEQYKDDPQGLTHLMNRLLTPLTNAIVGHKGTIDKYIGDAIMAFWNAPLDDPDQEANACAAALDMLAAIERLNAERRAEAEAAGTPFLPMRVGIGINTGPCVVGNMGSDLHFNYSVLGDAVNLAARLESQTKSYGVSVLIGARTAAKVADEFAVLELDLLQVKGKTEPERIYTVLGRKDGALGACFAALAELNPQMLSHYRGRDWQQCLEVILRCREIGREAGLEEFYNLYVERVRRLIEAPPEPGWDGVWVAERK
ncbi:MAG TPA: adenylate/guanylate cyclase domain-containing protein [Beijerinckiaceae bacterium]